MEGDRASGSRISRRVLGTILIVVVALGAVLAVGIPRLPTTRVSPRPPSPPPPPRTGGGGSTGSTGSSGGNSSGTTPQGAQGLILNQSITSGITLEFYFVAGTHLNGTIRWLSGAMQFAIIPVGHNPVWGTTLGPYWQSASWNFTLSTEKIPYFYFPGYYYFQFSEDGSAYVIGSAT